jgi:hypothetical protein
VENISDERIKLIIQKCIDLCVIEEKLVIEKCEINDMIIGLAENLYAMKYDIIKLHEYMHEIKTDENAHHIGLLRHVYESMRYGVKWRRLQKNKNSFMYADPPYLNTVDNYTEKMGR